MKNKENSHCDLTLVIWIVMILCALAFYFDK